jgi:hypothetical protein
MIICRLPADIIEPKQVRKIPFLTPRSVSPAARKALEPETGQAR